MRLKLKKIIAASIILTVGVIGVTAGAYTIEYSNGFSPIPAYVKCYSGFTNETMTAIHNACLAWNMVHDGDLVYRYTQTHSNNQYPLKNDVNEITKGYRGDDKYIMQTNFVSTFFNTIYEADIDMNVSHPFGTASTSYDTQTAMTHDIGHLLGLGHSNSITACMYPNSQPGQIEGVSQDDINGINAIY